MFWPERNKSASSVLLLQLATVDSFVLVIWAVLCIHWVLEFFVDEPLAIVSISSPYMSKYGWVIGNTFQLLTCWLIVNITALRYVAVCHPHKMRILGSVKVAWIQLGILILACVIFKIPHFFETNIVILESGEVGTKKAWFVHTDEYQIYSSISFYLLIFIIPVGLLIFFTAALIRQLKKSNLKVKGNQVQSSAVSGVINSIVPHTTNDPAISENGKNHTAKAPNTNNIQPPAVSDSCSFVPSITKTSADTGSFNQLTQPTNVETNPLQQSTIAVATPSVATRMTKVSTTNT